MPMTNDEIVKAMCELSVFVLDVHKQVGPCSVEVLTQEVASILEVQVTDRFSYLVRIAFDLLQQSGRC